MTGRKRFSVFGVYVTESVRDALSERLYETAGIVELDDYFDESVGHSLAEDPGAEATDDLVRDVVDEFADLYDAAPFDEATLVNPDDFHLVTFAAEPRRVSRARELFRAAVTIQDTDLRTVQTAIFAAALDVPVTPSDEV